LQLKKLQKETKIIDFKDNIFFFFFVKKERKKSTYYCYCELENERKKSLVEEKYLKGYSLRYIKHDCFGLTACSLACTADFESFIDCRHCRPKQFLFKSQNLNSFNITPLLLLS